MKEQKIINVIDEHNTLLEALEELFRKGITLNEERIKLLQNLDKKN
jgi:hypothetical protein